jgi:exosome complex component RRP40
VGKLNKFDAPQLTCISEHQSKNWASGESYFGVLKGGMVFNFPKIYSWDLFESETIKRLQDIITFEIAIGFNGKIWINSEENIYDIYNIIKSSLAMNKSEVEKIIHETFIDKMKVD